MQITIKAKHIKPTEYSIINISDKIEISLLLLKLHTPQSIKMIPVIIHKLFVMKSISNHAIPCTNHHKQENSR